MSTVGVSEGRWSIWPKISGRRCRPQPTFLRVSETRMIELSYGQECKQKIILFCHNPHVWQTDRQTERRQQELASNIVWRSLKCAENTDLMWWCSDCADDNDRSNSAILVSNLYVHSSVHDLDLWWSSTPKPSRQQYTDDQIHRLFGSLPVWVH